MGRIHFLMRAHPSPPSFMRGLFITLEGIDGTGKSTQLGRLSRHLSKLGYRVRTTREPGGTRLGDAIRRLLVRGRKFKISPLAELTLMYAARAEHLAEVIRPALERGEWVLSDRFSLASFAYQGYGRKLGKKVVAELDRAICGSLQPDLTILLDLDPRSALARAHSRQSRRGATSSRFEKEGLRFLKRVRRGYLELARESPGSIKVVSAAGKPGDVERKIRSIVEDFLKR